MLGRPLNRRPVLASAALLLAVGRTATNSPPTTNPTTTAGSPLAALIHQLGADDEADRTAAQRQLVDLGDAALAPLQSAATVDADPEVRARAAAAVVEIGDRAANGPTLLTVHATGADPRAVFGDIGRQSHVDILASFPAAVDMGPTVTIDAVRRPFWDVMADACGQAHVCPMLESPARGTLRLGVVDRNWIRDAPHQVVGPFWVGVAGVYRMAAVDLAGPPVVDDQFLARLIVFPEPKLVVTAVSPLVVLDAADDAGHSLVPPPSLNAGLRALARAAARLPARTVEARLHYPTDGHPGRRIATLAGELTVTLAQSAQRFEADDVLNRPTVTRPLPGVSIRVGVARADAADVYQVTVDCRRDGTADDRWTALVNRVADLTVLDAAGHALTPLGWSIDSANTRAAFKATGAFTRTPQAEVLMNRPAAAAAKTIPVTPGEPRRLVWPVADQFRTVVVPVAFHDLPMP